LADGQTCQTCTNNAQCADTNPCTADTCNLGTGSCDHNPLPGNSCEVDGNDCTAGTCNAAASCSESPVAPGSPCTADANPCTADACNAGGSCIGTPLAPGTIINQDCICNAGGVCVDCDRDGDGYNRTDQAAYCANGNDCYDFGSWNGVLAGNINPGRAENTLALCTDGADNNCNNRANYDGYYNNALIYTPTPPLTPWGDLTCPVDVTTFVAPPTIYRNVKFLVNCTTSVGSVRSLQFTTSNPGITCSPSSDGARWIGNKFILNCTTSVDAGWITCGVNPMVTQAGAEPSKTVTFDLKGATPCTPTNPCLCEASEAGFCTDNKDNDCNNEADYDGGTTGLHGDTACRVTPSLAQALIPACYGPQGLLRANCTYNVQNNGTVAYIEQREIDWEFGSPDVVYRRNCSFISWQGTVALFNCSTANPFIWSQNAPTYSPAYQHRFFCGVNLSKSYAGGADRVAAVTINRVGQVCEGLGVCLASGLCPICDRDNDGYNASVMDLMTQLCASSRPFDCNDNDAAVHPGAPLVCGNGIFEDCGSCDPFCNVQWAGLAKNNNGDLITDVDITFSWNGGSETEQPLGDGSFSVGLVPNGTHTLRAIALGYEPFVLPDQVFGCVSPGLVNITLEGASCKADCSFGSFCDPKCVNINGCPGAGDFLLNSSGDPTSFTVADGLGVCAGAAPGVLRNLDMDNKIVCCSGTVISATDLRTPLTVQGTANNLIRTSKLIFYNGQQVEMVALMYAE
jgi:hypothetical protein